MMKSEILTDEKCPDCGEQLYYDPGDWGDFNNPPVPDEVYCLECGYDRAPTAQDYEILRANDEQI